MKYYTIQNGCILTSENKEILEKYYNEALELPEDYIEGKYVAKDGKLKLVEDFVDKSGNLQILTQLNAIDFKSIRAIRANELDRLAEYEAQAIELRKKLK